jgi:hypothetical protein
MTAVIIIISMPLIESVSPSVPKLVDLLGERLGVAHDGERRDENGAEEPAQHEAEPGEAPQVGQPALAEREEEYGGGHARRQRPFAADPRNDGRRHR